MASAKGVLRNVQAQEEASPHSPREGGVLRNDELARQLEQLKDIDALQALAHSMAAGGKEGSSVLTTAQLGEVISALQAQVQAEVATHHDDLLQQLSSLKDTEGVLSVVRAGVDSLLASVQRVRAEIADPYRAIQVKTRQLAALYDTMELLRAVIKYLKLVRKLWEHLNVGVEKAELGKAGQVHKLREHLGAGVEKAELGKAGQVWREVRKLQEHLNGGVEKAELGKAGQVWQDVGTQMSPFPLNPLLSPPQVRKLREHLAAGVEKAELSKAGQVWQEVGAVHREAQLGGVHVVEAQHEWVAEAGQAIRREAMKALEGGMEAMNQAEVGSVLQVFFNMGELRQTVDQLVAKHKGQAMRAVATGLDMKAISASMGASGGGGGLGGSVGGPGGAMRSGTPPMGGAPRAREALWQRLTGCLDELARVMVLTWHLQRVMAKKRDPISHVVFLDHVLQVGGGGVVVRGKGEGWGVGEGGREGVEGVWEGVGLASGSRGRPADRAGVGGLTPGLLLAATSHVHRLLLRQRDLRLRLPPPPRLPRILPGPPAGGSSACSPSSPPPTPMCLQSGDALPTERVWEALLRAFSSQLRATFTASSFVKETFVSAYPRLLASLESFLDRLHADTDVRVLGGGGGGAGGGGAGGAGGGGFGLGAVGGGAVAGSWANGGTPAVISVEHRAQMMAALEPFQAAYLALSLSRMTDPINTMMPAAGGGRGGVPGPEAGGLLRLVLANAGKALQLLAERCEYQVATGPGSRQVLAPCSPAQQRNISLCVLLGAVHTRCMHLLTILPFSPPLHPPGGYRPRVTPGPGPLLASAAAQHRPVRAAGGSARALHTPPHYILHPCPTPFLSPHPLQVATGPESRQVLAPCSPAQQRNISLCVLLGAVHTRCMQLLARLPEEADSVMEAGVGSVHGVAMDAVAPLFKVCGFISCLDVSKLLARLPEEADCVMEAGVESVHGVAMDAVAPLFKHMIFHGPSDCVMEAGVGSVRAVLGVAMHAVAPLFKAMRDRIEACLLQIHQQDFSSDDPNAPPASTTPPPPGSASRNRTSSSGGSTPPHKHNQHNQNQQHESAGDNCSPYMENTIRAITHFHSEFLSKLLLPDSSSTSSSSSAAPASSIFAASLSGAAGSGPLSPSTALPPATVSEPVAQSLAKRLASRTLLFFVRHASLVRPLSEAGRLRLARDMGELEFAVGQHLFPTHALGASYRALRAFRPLLFVDLEKIPTSSLLQARDMGELGFAVGQHLFPTHVLGASYRALRAFRPLLFLDLEKIPTSSLLQDLPPSVVLHHLFSRAPPEMLSPFTCSLPHYNFPPSPPGPPYSPPQDLPPSVVLHHLFSRAPPELLSPFTRIQQPPARYSLWLDHCTEQRTEQRTEQHIRTIHPLLLCALAPSAGICQSTHSHSPILLTRIPVPPSPTQDLPPSVVLHHLFSRAPPELLSPFTRIQQPPARYSLWLDQHSQQEEEQLLHSTHPLPLCFCSFRQDLPPSVVLHHLFSCAPPELLSPFTRIQQPPARYSLWLDQHSQRQKKQLLHTAHPLPLCFCSFCLDLPPSVVLHHLFSRAPPELLSPFTRIQQPPARYSLWLDQHSQQQAWQGIKASLDDYVGNVRARGGKEFHPVYAVMLQLGQTLLHSQQQAWQSIKSSLDDYVGSVNVRGGKEFHPVYLVMLQLGQALLAGGNEGK
ncbi:unnamed protein product [Closterium sp. NIES-65]|nr:unnamed protein product [Closterium sp. NIES-65]